jgi:cyanate lyase
MSFVAVAIGGGVWLAGGIASNAVAASKAGDAADKMESLAGQVPKAKKSEYPALAIAQAKSELNAQNPFLSYQNRAIQGTQANSQAMAQKNALDPTMLLKMTQAYNSMSQDATMKNMMANYGMRENKLQNLYRGYQMGQQQDQMDYDNSMTAFNSTANLYNAAGQTRVNAWQNFGNGLMSAGSAVLGGAAARYKG